MTCNVFGETLNLTQSNPALTFAAVSNVLLGYVGWVLMRVVTMVSQNL